ncbi:MAG: hypothetical protein K9W43_05410 [Candidatus Thorarchaeota archaeon]|nr:hypothetical protein [Candidatus Thorarchaeota archaeon]
MSSKNASFKTLLEDVKIGFKFALRNFISFFLGAIGVILLSLVLLGVIIAIGMGIFFIWAGNIQEFVMWIIQTSTEMNNTTGMIIVGAIIFVILPILLPVFIAGGAMFGMGREVIESNGTTAEGVFRWYKSKFLTLAAGGTLAFLIVAGPLIVLMTIMGMFSGGVIIDGPLILLSVVSTIWLLVSTGMLTMLFPAIIDGQSAVQALRTSLRYGTKYFDRVFSTWFAFVIINVVLMLPMLVLNPVILVGTGYVSVIISYGVIYGLILVFVFFPAVTITLNRVYLILSGENDWPIDTIDASDIEVVGGI